MLLRVYVLNNAARLFVLTQLQMRHSGHHNRMGALMSVHLIHEGCMSAGGIEGNGFKALTKLS